jgi:hypothetical protein
MSTITIQPPLISLLRLPITKAERVDTMIQELKNSGLLDDAMLACLASWKYDDKDVRLIQLTSVILIPLLLKTEDAGTQIQLFSFRERIRNILGYTEEEMQNQIQTAQLASAQQGRNNLIHETFVKAAAHLHEKVNHSIEAREREVRQIEETVAEQLDQLEITESLLSQRAEGLLNREEALHKRFQQTIAATQTLATQLEEGKTSLLSTLQTAATLLGDK